MPIKIVDLKEMARQPEPKRTVLINGPRLHAWFLRELVARYRQSAAGPAA